MESLTLRARHPSGPVARASLLMSHSNNHYLRLLLQIEYVEGKPLTKKTYGFRVQPVTTVSEPREFW